MSIIQYLNERAELTPNSIIFLRSSEITTLFGEHYTKMMVDRYLYWIVFEEDGIFYRGSVTIDLDGSHILTSVKDENGKKCFYSTFTDEEITQLKQMKEMKEKELQFINNVLENKLYRLKGLFTD